MRYTAEQIQVVINEWEFCHQRDICHQTFYNWIKRANQIPSSGFTEVTLPPRERTGGCEIIFPFGARMVFAGEPPASWLREVLR